MHVLISFINIFQMIYKGFECRLKFVQSVGDFFLESNQEQENLFLYSCRLTVQLPLYFYSSPHQQSHSAELKTSLEVYFSRHHHH